MTHQRITPATGDKPHQDEKEGGERVKVIIDGELKEIAALVAALQERRTVDVAYSPIWPKIEALLLEHPELFTSGGSDNQDA